MGSHEDFYRHEPEGTLYALIVDDASGFVGAVSGPLQLRDLDADPWDLAKGGKFEDLDWAREEFAKGAFVREDR